jgi:hypothetical protein
VYQSEKERRLTSHLCCLHSADDESAIVVKPELTSEGISDHS